jgi:hypothetical protein
MKERPMNLREVGRGTLWFAIGLVVAAVPSFLLRPRLPPEAVTTVLRSYAVRPEIAGEMKGALTEAFGVLPWRVSVTADKRLLVSAPESVQKGGALHRAAAFDLFC